MNSFIVENGSRGYEIHAYTYDNDGRRWEETIAGPFKTFEDAKKWQYPDFPCSDPYID